MWDKGLAASVAGQGSGFTATGSGQGIGVTATSAGQGRGSSRTYVLASPQIFPTIQAAQEPVHVLAGGTMILNNSYGSGIRPKAGKIVKRFRCGYSKRKE